MRTSILLAVTMVLSACGGNWSNRDLDFVNALPDRSTLQSKLPVTAITMSPLEGTATRRDGLEVGDPSKAYADTKKASTDFNAILTSMLSALELTRKVAPTARTATTRVWGPYPDSKNPGFEFRIAVTQVDETNFGWKVESRKLPGDFFALAIGQYAATQSLKKGRGAMSLLVKGFKNQIAVEEGLKALDQIDIGYITDTFPMRVEMLFTFAPGNASGLSAIGYTSREQADGSGSMRYQLVAPANTDASVLEVTAAWLPSGAGQATGAVIAGTHTGATQRECWDASFALRYFEQTWLGGQRLGANSDCVTVAGF